MRKLLSPFWLLMAGLSLALATFAVLWLVPSGDYIYLPDRATPLAPLVSIEGEKPSRGGGGIYFVDAIVRKARLIESVFPSIRSGATIVPGREVNPPGQDDAARRQEDLREMARSQQIAPAVALRALGYAVVARPRGTIVTAVASDGPAAGHLQRGDVIVSVDGRTSRTPTALRRQIGRHRPGERVRLGVRRGSSTRAVVLRTIADPRNRSRPIIGVFISQSAEIKLPIRVRIDTRGIGGPSAGLAFALDVMEELGRDVDRGYKIAATGELALDGSVLAIGAIKQKTIGVRRAKIDLFLVPGENAPEARRYAHGLRIVPVNSFRQALRILSTLPPKP
jgi:PDZ domain-containing protein